MIKYRQVGQGQNPVEFLFFCQKYVFSMLILTQFAVTKVGFAPL